MSEREHGTFYGDYFLSTLYKILKNVYLPLLESSKKEKELYSSLHVDFLSQMKKFVKHLYYTRKQLKEGVNLEIPEIKSVEPKEAVKDEQYVEEIEHKFETWTNLIRKLIEDTNSIPHPTPNEGPLSEIDYWRQRSASFATLWDQLNDPKVKYLNNVLEMYENSQHLDGFQGCLGELTKFYNEAQDNVKFLETLERHFKNIRRARNSLLPIFDTLPSMMRALDMVWTISRHYNSEKRMQPLMVLIANEIAQKVEDFILIESEQTLEVMYNKPDLIIEKLEESKKVLEKWKEIYVIQRQKIIEKSHGVSPWDFDRDRLFERTNFIRDRCVNLLRVVRVLKKHKDFLGPKMVAATGDKRGVTEVLDSVKRLLDPINAFNGVFDINNLKKWRTAMKVFDKNCEVVEQQIIGFVDDSFSKLNSAEGAFKLLRDVQIARVKGQLDSDEIKTSVDSSVKLKKSQILERFRTEVQEIQDIFDKEHLSPPTTKNLPPVAGAIYWAESLFQRIFKPLDTIDRKILDNEKGQRVKNLCHHVGKSIKEYQVQKFKVWKQNVENRTKELLEQNILITDIDYQNGRVNFSNELTLIVQETKYLGKLISNMRREEDEARKRKRKLREQEGHVIRDIKDVGLVFWKNFDDVPRFALNVTLQEAKYHHYIEELKLMLENYRTTISLLEKPEKYILKRSILELEKKLSGGFEVLNWNSLGINGFITQCNRQITTFQTIVKKLQKNTRILRGLVNSIKYARILYTPSELKRKKYDLQELYDKTIEYQKEQVTILVKKYKTISQTLLKIRGDLISFNVLENVKKSVDLSSYYSYWEKKVHRALFSMLMSNLKILQDFRHTPEIIVVHISLLHQDIQITPSRNDVISVMDKMAKNILQSTQSFIRWVPGTCEQITVKHLNVEDKAGVLTKKCSFFADIWPTFINKDKENVYTTQTTIHLNNAFQTIGEYTSECMDQVEECVEEYEKFSKYWKRQTEQVVKKFSEKDPAFKKYDSKIERLKKDIENVELSKQFHVKRFVLVDFTSLKNALIKRMESWVQEYGKLLKLKALPIIEYLLGKMDVYNKKLDSKIENLDELRDVLTTIQDIYENSVDIEREYMKIHSCYNTVVIHGITASPEEIDLAQKGIEDKWFMLKEKTKKMEKSLGPEKNKFTEKTKINVQKFFASINEFKRRLGRPKGPISSSIELEDGLKRMEECDKEMKSFQEERDYLVQSEKLFDLPITSYPTLIEIEQIMKNEGKAYKFFKEFKEYEDRWSSTLFKHVQIDGIKQVTRTFLLKLKKQFSNDERQTTTYEKVRNRIIDFNKSIPMFSSLRSDALKTRHWESIMKKTGVTININSEDFTLGKLFNMKLYRFEEEIDEIFNNANAELRMEELLRNITESWRNRKFTLKEYIRDNKKRGYIIVEKDEIKSFLEDDTMQLSSIAGSPHVEFFEQELHNLERSLSVIDEVLDLWIDVQHSWINLEVIFIGSRDIREQLPHLANQFDKLDEDWVKIMIDVGKNRNIKEATKYPGRKELLDNLKTRLQRCQKGLANYLQSKRELFPRFFYISDEELLSILGSSEPKFIQLHVPKMYPNCGKLLLKPNTKTVVGMESMEGEFFNFKDHVSGDRSVEQWLDEITKGMKASLRRITKQSIFHYPKKDRIKWILDNLGMVALLGCQIWWTWEVEDAFASVKKGERLAVKNLSKKLTNQIVSLVKEIRKPSLSKTQRKKLTTCIVIDVHARDIVDVLVRDSINDKNDFAWESQLRFYWNRNDDTCKINQCTGEFDYGYEYQGINGRLVITPLTDRCFMTLTQALKFHLGGSPAGPAGTGKTESVKDLAKAMGKMCIVYNCSLSLDNVTMSRLFSGLCQNGAWGCFDEFNRIELSVLSVIATQIRSIQEALRSNLKIFRFDEQDINLNKNIGVFVTMNPGYAGRVELPDNLAALFRPCVMVVPDMDTICEILLFSEGFIKSRQLSRKMVKLYYLAEGQLSKQRHYDWGLRAIKSVLTKAGHLKQKSPDTDENKVLMKALYDMNVAKFIFEDRPLFEDLLNDLFVTEEIDKSSNKAFYNEVKRVLVSKKYHLVEDDNQIQKVIQLCDTINARHSTMVVGDTCGGKSVVIQTLAEAQTNLGYKTTLYIINPKAQTVSELYGVMNNETKDWEDGLLSNIFREINKKTKNIQDRRYIVFDGDVDPVWVESMNSVMDDNKLLTLPNGERITLLKQCKLLFEVGDLSFASPATVSRCGMVYVDPKNLGYKPYFYRWLDLHIRGGEHSEGEEEIEDFRKMFLDYFQRYAIRSVEFILNGIQDDGSLGQPLNLIIPYTGLNMISQLCNLCQSMLPSFESIIKNPLQMETLFMFCVLWSIGATIVEEERVKFDKFIKSITPFTALNNDDGSYIPVGAYPTNQTLYEYYFNCKTNTWENWKRIVPAYVPPEDGKFSSILVPTVDTVRYSYFLDKILEIEKPVLFVGIPGTAKTVIVNSFIKKKVSNNPLKNTSLNIHFSSRTTSIELQRTIEDHVEKRIGDRYGPKDNKHMYIFIDELNMPNKDEYGTQQPIALLNFMLQRQGFYERKSKATTERIPLFRLRDVVYVAAMGAPGFGKNDIDPRFVSKFNVFNLTFPSNESILNIYSSILNYHFDFYKFDENIQLLGDAISKATLNLHKFVVSNLPPTPSKFHYVFNLRDLSRVHEGICLATKQNFDEPWKMIKLWRNECMRVYWDRLIDDKDKTLVKKRIDSLSGDVDPRASTKALMNPLLFGDFEDLDNRESMYNDLKNFNYVKMKLNDVIDTYNLDSDKDSLNLVMFDDAIDHLVRIYRIIKMDKGHALLVGVGGSGKQSLTKLAAYLAQYEIFAIKLSRNYNEKKFRDDLKGLFHILGVIGKKTVFLFTDACVIHECFLEYINNLLTSGMIAALFDNDEKLQLISEISKEAKDCGIRTNEDKWKFFIEKCRNNLHMVLTMSPGKQLRERCRNFPGLVNNTTIDWFSSWPAQALREVAIKFLEDEDLKDNNGDTYMNEIVDQMISVHTSVTKFSEDFFQQYKRYTYVTPKNYINFIKTYLKLLKQCRKKLDINSDRLSGGLHQLSKAKDDVDILHNELERTKAEVEGKQQEVTELQKEINEKQKEAKKQQEECTEKEKELHKRTIEISKKKDKAQKLLMKAEPILANSEDALQELQSRRSDLQEMRSFKNPHDYVKEVGNTLTILLTKGTIDPSWKLAQKIMTSPSFITDLINFNKKRITEGKVRKIREIMAKKGKNFNSIEIRKQSRAASVILTWIESICDYYDIFSQVKPLRAQLERETIKFDKTQRELVLIQERLAQLKRVLNNLDLEKDAAEKESERLLKKSKLMKRKLNAANKLISGLSSERKRWTSQIHKYKEDKIKLIGDCLLSSAFLSYLGPFTIDYRKQMVYKLWYSEIMKKGIPVSDKFNLKDILADDVEISRWESEGLPSDEVSIQNGMLTTNANRFPLCIDPQLQALLWIKEKEKKELIVKSFNDDFMKHLENAIRFGQSFLFEDVDEFVDPIIEPILEFNVQKKRRVITLGDEEIEVDPNFKLYLCTRLSNPYYSPEIQGKTMVINYSVTFEGLQEQLLSEVVKFESRSLENERLNLIHQTSENKNLLRSFEMKILMELNISKETSLLDNVELIEMLENTRSKVVETNLKLKELETSNKDIKEQRETYRKVAKRGAILFFVISTLSSINSMYEYSLSSFMKDVFQQSLEKSKKTSTMSVSTRLHNIIEYLTYNVYCYTCNGLFEKDKITFSMLMCLKIMEGEGEIGSEEVDFFMKGYVSLSKVTEPKLFSWITDQGWKDLLLLRTLHPIFKEVVKHLESKSKEWEKWYRSDTPETGPYPTPYNKPEVTDFQKLCLLRCFRVDRVIKGVSKFISESKHLGPKFVSPPVLDYLKVFRQSINTSPIICMICKGYDPAGSILKLADRIGQRCYSISLGQGVGQKAKEMIMKGIHKGYWILLQNCHLLVNWLKEVEKILNGMEKSKVHTKFRLWMTSALSEKFPVSLLQRSLKIVTEPPNSLKLNMISSYSTIGEEQLESCPHEAFKPLIFVLTYFHAIIQERKKYGKIGWNVPYDFTTSGQGSDYMISFSLLNTYLTKAKNYKEPIPWDSLKYLVGEAMYGGRVTDDVDRRILITYLNEYLGDFLFDSFQPFHFYKTDEIDYKLPDGCIKEVEKWPKARYLEYIEENVNLENNPDVIGLHSIAEISYLTNCSKYLWSNLIKLESKKSQKSTSDSSFEEKIKDRITMIEKIMPNDFDRNALIKKVGSPDPIQVVLLQEIERWNILIEVMNESISKLSLALSGKIGMSLELEELGFSLANGIVPVLWKKHAPPSKKNLSSWFEHLQKRYEQYHYWVENNTDPDVIWLSGLHIPESYLTSIVQVTCKKHKWPLDKVVLFSVVTEYVNEDEIKEKPDDGCFIKGLFIEGARWNLQSKVLEDQKKKIIEELPIVKIIPLEVKKLKVQNTFKAPVYQTTDRGNAADADIVFEANLATKKT